MTLSFSEFNALYENYNETEVAEYSNGIEIMESLFTVMNKKEILTETEVVTFLDTVLEETGWELNDEVYESYGDWLADWSPFFDEGVNENEDELIFALTHRGETFLEESLSDKVSDGKKLIKDGVKDLGTRFSDNSAKNLKGTRSSKISNTGAAIRKTFNDSSKGQKIGLGVAGGLAAAGAGYGAYKGIKALKKRRTDKKEAKLNNQQSQAQ